MKGHGVWERDGGSETWRWGGGEGVRSGGREITALCRSLSLSESSCVCHSKRLAGRDRAGAHLGNLFNTHTHTKQTLSMISFSQVRCSSKLAWSVNVDY